MSITAALSRGLTSQSLTEFITVYKGIELTVLALAGIAASYILPKFPYWFDKTIDRVTVLDFDENTKDEFSKIFQWSIYLTVLYLAFYILEFTLIHNNPLFQLVLLFFGIKVAIAALKPSMKKIDRKVDDVEVTEGSIMMKIMVISVYVIGMFIALSIFGLNGAITTALAGAGVLGLVIGFGAKDLVSNTLSGIFIAIDEPFHVGDIIEVNDKRGIVEDMGLRTTEIQTFDNKAIVVPNTKLIDSPVTNYTANDIRRLSVKVGIDYDTDLSRGLKVLRESLSDLEYRVEEKGIDVLLRELGDSSIVLEGRLWINQKENSIVKTESKIKELIFDKFQEEEIDIPFPTRVIIQK